jgi:DNA-binding response OmpR family regulator
MMAANPRRDKGELNELRHTDDSYTAGVAADSRSAGSTGPGSVETMRILVVDDEPDLADAVARGLRREGYAVDVAHDGETAIEKASVTPYDLVCLDLTMPGMDGLEVCRRLREEPPEGVPPRVLMLTARDSIDDRIRGLDHGADDYLVKPFAFGELVARVRSLLRREASRSSSVLTVGELELDDVRHRATRGGRELDLTAKEFALLRYFMVHPDDVMSQEHLLEHVWDEHADPFTNTVRVTVGTLRRKLSDDGGEKLIETVIGSGYRLIAPRESSDG